MAKRRRVTVDWAAKLAAMVSQQGATLGDGATDASPSQDCVIARKGGKVGGDQPCFHKMLSPRVRSQDLDHPCRFGDLLRSEDNAGGPRVAITVCMRGCPAPRLREWLFWHLSQGVCVIFLRWEGPLNKEQKAALHGPLQRGEVLLTQISTSRQSSSFQAVMSRQVKFTHSSISAARERGCDFLLHLDDDELLCPRDENSNILNVFKRHVGSSAKCIHFANLEAVFRYDQATDQPFSRPCTCFRTQAHVLYCNGKSAANLTAPGDVFCSGVHHFCQYDRSFEPPLPEYGLHDDGSGCTHPSCCSNDDAAVVLHFDSPSFEEWQVKFRARAMSKFSEQDDEELQIFPFKKESLRTLRRANSSESEQRRVYRRWRCLPGLPHDSFDPFLTGQTVAARLTQALHCARQHAAGRCLGCSEV